VTASSGTGRNNPETVVNYTFESGKLTTHYGEDIGQEDGRQTTIRALNGSGYRFGKEEMERIQKAIGGNHRGHFWRFWMPRAEDAQPWIEVDLGGPQTFERVKLTEQYSKIQGYELQYHDGGDWQTFYSGKMVDDLSLHLTRPVTASCVRLLITKTSGEPPQLKEFDLF